MVEVFAEHCENIARILEKNEKTQAVTARWIELGVSKPDHFRQAWNYDCLNWYTGQKTMKAESGIRTPDNIRELLKKELR
jgi:hypothetical protein